MPSYVNCSSPRFAAFAHRFRQYLPYPERITPEAKDLSFACPIGGCHLGDFHLILSFTQVFCKLLITRPFCVKIVYTACGNAWEHCLRRKRTPFGLASALIILYIAKIIKTSIAEIIGTLKK